MDTEYEAAEDVDDLSAPFPVGLNDSILMNISTTPEYVYDIDDSQVDWEELAPVALVYGLTLILGVLGNSLIIFTIAKYRRMRSITNVFLASLATADLLLILICIPIKFAKLFSFTWTFGAVMCKFVHYIQNVSAICSVLTLTSMSLERYYAILHPMKAKYICTISQARKIIVAIWIVSFILALPVIYVQVLRPVGMFSDTYWCVMHWDNRPMWQAYEVYMLLLLLVCPTGLMAFAYASICCEVWHVMKQRAIMVGGSRKEVRNGKDANSHSESHPMTTLSANDANSFGNHHNVSRSFSKNSEESATVKQVIKMLVAVVVLFIICWTPLLVSNVLTSFGHLHPLNYGALKPLRTAFHLLAYLNSCINPIVYGFMSRNFREGVLHVLCGWRSSGRAYGRQLSFTHTRTTSVSLGRSMSVSTTANTDRPIADNNAILGGGADVHIRGMV